MNTKRAWFAWCRRGAPAGALLALWLGACSDVSRLGGNVPLSATPRQQAETNPAIIREHQRILATYGGAYDDPRLEQLINKTVERLVAASERPDLSYKITILNSPAINAFALPSGQLYVTRGLIALASDTSELASVLSHEMAHVIANHAAIREDQIRQAALVSRIAGEVFNDPQTSALSLAKSKIALASFSRSQELEADGIGVGISSRAGFDPYGAVRFLSAMGRNAELKASASNSDHQPLDFFSSHPATPERVKIAQANARQFSAPGKGERDRAAYLAAINGLTYGDDPNEGFVRGRHFLHPRLGFTFTAPEGFTLDNTAQAVLGVKEGGEQALRVDVVRVPAEQTLAAYLASGWIENVDTSTVENIAIGDFSAATAIAKGGQWTFRLYVVRFDGDEIYRFIFATKGALPEADRAFRDAVNSFRRMSAVEIRSVRPLHLKLVTVRPGDSVERLASRMAGVSRPLERFLVINGLAADQALKPGEMVKIIAE